MNHAEPAHNASITVLLVDDQPFVGLAIKRLLAAETDITVHCCQSAQTALRAATTLRPSVILQDLAMPDGDGLTVVAGYRSHAVTAGTPVVVLADNDDPGSREQSMIAGADEVLVKLPPRLELVACIRRFAGSVGGATVAADRTSPAATDTEPCLDPQVLADVAGASAEFANELVDLFVADARGRVNALVEALDAGDRTGLRTTAHALKGSAGAVGARRLSAVCHVLERHANSSTDHYADAQLVADITRELAAVVTAFAAANLGTQRDARGVV
jgi:DNA-binding NarL/FixJ family response regulator